MEPRAGVSWWTDELVESLKDLLAEGLSASQIGAQLGCTRNAVIGKARRIKATFERVPGRLKGEERPKARHIRPRPPVMRPNMMTINAKAARRDPFKVPRPLLAPEKVKDELFIPPLSTRKSFLELNPGDCRWPHGDVGEEGFFFCGSHQVNDRPYCGPHCAIAYVPTTGLVRRRKDYEVVA